MHILPQALLRSYSAMRYSAVICCCIALLGSCTKNGPVPSYVVLKPAVVLAANGRDTLSSRITDFWVYVNDQPAGVWEAGKRIPVIAEGATELKLIAGVRRNGVVSDRIQYPHYLTMASTVDLLPELARTVEPVFRYSNNLTIWSEPFENSGMLLEPDTSIGQAAFTIEPNGPWSSYGQIVLNEENRAFRAVTAEPFNVGAYDVAFIEFDHASDMQFQVGIRYTSTAGITYHVPYLTVQPSLQQDGMPVWSHLYIEATSLFQSVSGSDKRIYFSSSLGSLTRGTVKLDNIRVVQ